MWSSSKLFTTTAPAPIAILFPRWIPPTIVTPMPIIQLSPKTGESVVPPVATNEVLICEVIGLYKYNNFEELYKNHDKESIGYAKDEKANPNDMLMYYSKENIEKYGVLGIELIVKQK